MKKLINQRFDFRFEGTDCLERRTKFKATLAYRRSLNEMSDEFSLPLVYQWLEILIASLDCYTWVFSQGFLNPLVLQSK